MSGHAEGTTGRVGTVEPMPRPTKPCVVCGEPFERNPKYGRAQWERASYCSNVCRGADLRHERRLCMCGCGERVAKPQSRWCPGHNPQAPAELRFDAHKGRWIIFGRDGRHHLWARVVAAGSLGRDLLPGEVVHHINNDKTDDRPENLQVFASHAEHAALHWAQGDFHRLH